MEHDVTFDLYEQLLRFDDRWELRRELDLWRKFETEAWRTVDRVVTMSEKDRRRVTPAAAVTLANGVDLDASVLPRTPPPQGRTRPHPLYWQLRPPAQRDGGGVLRQRSVAAARSVTLHIIAGTRHEQYAVAADLAQPGIELEGFVADVRPAYRRATLVVAPLVASAGTNIKVLEAMAMGKAVVSTPAGVNGMDLAPGQDFVLASPRGNGRRH